MDDQYTFENKTYRDTYRHTTSHILAQAMKRLYPEVKLAIGPAIEDGFYYDFDSPQPFTPEVLEKLEAEMRKICKEKLRLERFELPRAEALKFMEERDEPYKVELINDLPEDAVISFYRQGEFVDLCAGPHLDSTGRVKGNAIKLTSVTGAYWRGDSNRKMLQRIYGTCFPKKEELDAYLARKKKILAAVIEEYIRTAEPVGSKAIAASADLGCSSATIRNELAELVAMGYLEQPHTSAGRVPTPLGYRMYVNELMEHKDLTAEETQAITQSLTGRHQRGELMTDASRLASQLTNYPAVTLTTSAGVTIRRFDLIYLDANSFIIVLLLSDDTVKNKLVHLPVSAEQSMIQKLATVFNAHFTGIHESDITPVLIRSAERAAQDNLGITAVIAAFAIEVLTGAGAAQTYLVGESQLLHQPEFRDPDKAHRLMSYLSDGSNLLDIPMEQLGGDNEVRVLIGPENVAEELRDSSVVLATYDAGENMRGLIGVVGPTRMDYSKVAAKLSFIAAGLSKLLGGGTLPPPGLDNKLIIKGDDTDEHENERPEADGAGNGSGC